MANKDKASDTNTNTTGAATAPATAAAGELAPAAKAGKARFTIKATEKSGPVQTYHGVRIDNHGVGYCDVPGSAYHCVLEGYDVRDANNDGKPYDGTNPANVPVNA